MSDASKEASFLNMQLFSQQQQSWNQTVCMADMLKALRELQEQVGEVRDMLACYKSPFALTPEERLEWSERLAREGQRSARLVEETRK